MPVLYVLSGGAAAGLIATVKPQFKTQTGFDMEGEFGAVGVMKERLLAGAPCDVLILTEALIAQLTQSGQVKAGGATPLGLVMTGVAVKAGEPVPDVSTPEALKSALLAANGIYFPDPVKATAGSHFFKVLQQLGIDAELTSRLRPFPNGATAMREMAGCAEPNLIGCTQATEILYTPGVQLISDLPKAFELATVYTAGVASGTQQAEAATTLMDLLTSSAMAAQRNAAGFI